MKRLLPCLLILSVLILSVPALAEPAGTPDPIPEDTRVAVDLDGDGAEEVVSWAMVMGEYEAVLTLTVEAADGAAQTYPTDILGIGAVYVTDLDGDGARELLMTGDVMSDDYYTWCLRYDRGALYEVLFPDSGRGTVIDAYFKYGYGLITAVGDNQITLSGSQDVLGTWFGSRTLTLAPSGHFEFDDDGLWTRDLGDPDNPDRDDPELWAYGALTVTQPLPYADLQGNPAGTLEPGARIRVCASDKREIARFIAQDGASGVLAISLDYERGWGWLVDGIPEDECFDMIPYAD